MTVTADYAQTHLEELLAAAERGEPVQIARQDGFAVKLISEPAPVPSNPIPDRRSLFDAAKGQIWYADDWDSPEVNEEIAHTLNESELFPPGS